MKILIMVIMFMLATLATTEVSANTATPIDNVNGQPTWHFWVGEQEYFVYMSIYSEEDPVPRAMYLAIPDLVNGIYVPYTQAYVMVLPSVIADLGTKRWVDEQFLPVANAFLASLEEEPDLSFPIDGNDLAQFQWIVEYDLQHTNGRISRIGE